MKVKLNRKEITDNLYSEYELSDLSIMESFYAMRKLKALCKSLEIGYIEIDTTNEHGQVYSSEFEIWINKDEYTVIN